MRNSTPLDGTVAPSTTLKWKSSKSGKTIVHFLNSECLCRLEMSVMSLWKWTLFFLLSSLQSPIALRSRWWDRRSADGKFAWLLHIVKHPKQMGTLSVCLLPPAAPLSHVPLPTREGPTSEHLHQIGMLILPIDIGLNFSMMKKVILLLINQALYGCLKTSN